MTILQTVGLKKGFGDRQILDDISFEIKNGERIGLVGWNGSGKTTLVKLIMGFMDADEGTIIKTPPKLRIGYLPQETEQTLSIEEELQEAGEKLMETSSYLGLEKAHHWEEERFRNLSGGEKLKLALAKIWASSPQLLVFDEPTNHLDFKGVNWLIEEMKTYGGAALIISHDRHFLDKTVTKIFELEDGKLTIFDGNYTDYRLEKQRRREQQQRDYTKQQRKIDMIEQQVTKFKQWSDKGHREAGIDPSSGKRINTKEYGRVQAKKKDVQIKSKLKRLDAELAKHKVEKPKEEATVQFDFGDGGKHGKRVLEARGLTKNFGERTLFEKSHFYAKYGERIGLIGENGSGKTTFIKMLLGEVPVTKGSLWKSDSIRIAYLSQEVTSDLPKSLTALDYLDIANREERAKARTIFANMGMKENKLLKPIGTLSLGERTRVKLVKMILSQYDILILDEPTNHLDLPCREQLEETLASYSGTLLIVSHDLYFMEKLCDKLFTFDNKRIQRVEMGLKEFHERKNKQNNSAQQDHVEKLSVLETEITALLGKIAALDPGTEEYNEVDKKLSLLIQKKQRLFNKK